MVYEGIFGSQYNCVYAFTFAYKCVCVSYVYVLVWVKMD